jgi:hypothetical protein
MAKKTLKVKFTGNKPEGNLLKAKIPDNATTKIMGEKVNLNHRASALIETGVNVKVEPGYKLCFSLVPELTNKGMVATNAPGNFTEGKVFANVINVGREIVEIKTGDPFLNFWFEQIIDMEWEQE